MPDAFDLTQDEALAALRRLSHAGSATAFTYEEIAAEVPGTAGMMLALALRALAQDGLVERSIGEAEQARFALAGGAG